MCTFRDPCPLHSFPTRRSSDLENRTARTRNDEAATITPRTVRAVPQAIDPRKRKPARTAPAFPPAPTIPATEPDRKSTRLNSSHLGISYAVFCLKKKKEHNTRA